MYEKVCENIVVIVLIVNYEVRMFQVKFVFLYIFICYVFVNYFIKQNNKVYKIFLIKMFKLIIILKCFNFINCIISIKNKVKYLGMIIKFFNLKIKF